MTILETIKERMAGLPRTQKKVAAYFLDNWEKVAYLSTSEVAAATELSQATIVRASVSLGFGGFVDLQDSLREFIQHRLSTIQRLDRLETVKTAKNTSDQEMAGTLFQRLMDNLDLTYQKLEIQEVGLSVKLISKARRVVVIGMRSSAAAAHYFGFNLSMIRNTVLVLTSDYGLSESLEDLTSDDVVVVFSFSRYTKTSIHATKIAQKLGAEVIAITDSSMSPLSEFARVSLVAATSSLHHNHSLVAVLGIIDLLLFSIARCNNAQTRSTLEHLEKSWETLGVFYHG